MAGERIDSLSEAQRLRSEHRVVDVAHVVPDIDARQAAQHSVTGTGMDGIEADFAELRSAEKRLADLSDELLDQLREAQELTGPLGDGGGPVTGPMRRAFGERADMEGGVQAALADYLEELLAVRGAILATLDTYGAVDDEAANRLNRQAAELDEVY